jgi:predicted Zn-dependent peptidase
MADLNAASLDDVKDFFRIYYAPNNAVLALVGDFEPAQALEKIKKYFGAIPSQPAPPASQPCEEERYGERREVVMDSLARLPLLLISYQIPAGNTPDNYAVRVLGDVLATGQSSRFYQHLVKDKQLATEASIQVDTRRGPSLMYITATPRPGVKAEDLEKAIYDEIDALARDGITDAELQKTRMGFRRRTVQGRESSLTTAIRLSTNAVYFNEPDLINTSLEKYNAVTADQVKAAARKYLAVNLRTVLVTLPQPSAEKSADQPGGQQ